VKNSEECLLKTSSPITFVISVIASPINPVYRKFFMGNLPTGQGPNKSSEGGSEQEAKKHPVVAVGKPGESRIH
jgi:hypothetical protein